ncbi:hypothetical protein DPMN_038315 [Dreissena polymorpha]|uniref:Uncharacterized protein n=1 Tax=Dreissena polymorpha TaxID=45954 RepID=A0A9D4RQK4_DREPO|nr:hypothetical protein DPMN_038315 [Dreissena polymorpha]
MVVEAPLEASLWLVQEIVSRRPAEEIKESVRMGRSGRRPRRTEDEVGIGTGPSLNRMRKESGGGRFDIARCADSEHVRFGTM